MTDENNVVQPEIASPPVKGNPNSTGTGIRKAINEGTFGGWQGGGKPKGTISTKPRKKNTSFDSVRRKRFLKSLEAHGNVRAAASAAGVHKQTVYLYMDKHPEFRELFEIARDKCLENLEDELQKRIYQGSETREYDGEDVLQKRIVKQDNRLLEIALKAADPQRYSTPVNGGVQINVESGGALEKLAGMLKIELPTKKLEASPIEGEWENVGEDSQIE